MGLSLLRGTQRLGLQEAELGLEPAGSQSAGEAMEARSGVELSPRPAGAEDGDPGEQAEGLGEAQRDPEVLGRILGPRIPALGGLSCPCLPPPA